MEKKIVLSGMRPTGRLHIGHWVGALSNWVSLQNEYNCFFMVADWHAIMSEYKDPSLIKEYSLDNVADWLSWGVNPKQAVVFVQSEVKEHIELFMLLSFITPLGWLSRCPTFKEQVQQLKEKEVNTYAFLGYPTLQSADITLYKADCVPVGEDQLPHLEMCREVVRRFNFLYKNKVLVEPQPLLTKESRLLGLDCRKMSKSYGNFIALDEDVDSIRRKVLSMITDPARIKKDDPGHPDICNVFTYHSVFNPAIKDEVCDWCVNAKKGCKDCKVLLADTLNDFIAPKREEKTKLLKDKKYLTEVLDSGKEKASSVAGATLKQVKEAMKLR
ncbi:MAG: tryptophan--tRNA ligase [Candidatus Omnitrophica bacterium]|nr:tryptophan--tRNA ligase [Candidatus Omnitrophota bacterium]